MLKKILFITSTRADFGKLKSLIRRTNESLSFDVQIFVTGMHMLQKYGSTWEEIEKSGFKNIYKFINQNNNNSMSEILSKSIMGLSDFIKENHQDMIVVHGDRIEALAGSVVGAMNNIYVSHIEGGEVSGTIDESIRHAISKFSHFHFVANENSKKRLIQLGEDKKNIFVIGSPDLDAMSSKNIPKIYEVKSHYNFDFNKYGILIYHPVTTELDNLAKNVADLVTAIINSSENYLVIYPNNDPGSDIIINEYQRFNDHSNRIKIFRSMRFEYFISALRNSSFIIGNSSAGVREAPFYSVPSINIGSRQHRRNLSDSILNSHDILNDYNSIIMKVKKAKLRKSTNFGSGNSAKKFAVILENSDLWKSQVQKSFIDI
jgi:UDP-N-acetylglucosamine 2-epimerase (hydrolysing)